MARVLVCGLCPLPFENTRKNYGPGIRTWQFASGLAQQGHQVRTIAMRIGDAYGAELPVSSETVDGIEIQRVSDVDFLTGTAVSDAIAAWQPEAVVGATIYGSHALARTIPTVPFWADQFGHVMAEAQAKAALEHTNWPLAYFWRLLRPVLAAADRFSAVSERHRYAVIGELGALGRLSAETAGYEFTAVVPCAAAIAPPTSAPPRIVRGMRAPADAFIVLWSGSYNVWSDVETLSAGLDTAMRAEPRIHFVSTGGAIDGHDDFSYARFEELARRSRWSDRYHLEGWVPHEQLPGYTAEADIGVLTERLMYEGALGSKNRIIHWLASGLPVAYNRVGDLGDLLFDRALGRTFPPCDPEALAREILAAARDPHGQREMAERARQYASAHLSFQATTRELAAWCAAPRTAPDRGIRPALESPADHATPAQRIAEQVPALRKSGTARLLGQLRKRWLAR